MLHKLELNQFVLGPSCYKWYQSQPGPVLDGGLQKEEEIQEKGIREQNFFKKGGMEEVLEV